MPPFGNLYDVPVYVDARLSEHAEIAFNAGSHTDLVRMPYAEFEQLAKPEPLWLAHVMRSEEHTSELQSLMRISYAVFCLKKKTTKNKKTRKRYVKLSMDHKTSQ